MLSALHALKMKCSHSALCILTCLLPFYDYFLIYSLQITSVVSIVFPVLLQKMRNEYATFCGFIQYFFSTLVIDLFHFEVII